MAFAVDNDISTLVGIVSSFEVLKEGRFHGSSKSVVQNGNEVKGDVTPLGALLITKIGSKILKLPINEGYIPKLTFLVSS